MSIISRTCRHRSILQWLDLSSRLVSPTATSRLQDSFCLKMMVQIPQRGMKRWQEKTLRAMYFRKKSFDVIPEKLQARSEWADWNYPAELFAFANRLQEPQLSQEILQRVFTHSNYVQAQQAQSEQLELAQLDFPDNQELIATGRGVMDNFVPLYLRYFLRKAPEECIQSVAKYLGSNEVLCEVAKWIGCIDLELCEELPPSESTLADTVPALIGAIATESGTARAHNFIIDFLLTYLQGADILEIWPLHDLHLDLDSYLAKHGLGGPTEPRILHQSAVGTLEACYVVGIYLNQKLIGQSPGETLAIAKRMAHLDAFRNLFGLTTSEVRFRFGTEAYKLEYQQCNKPNPSIMN